MIRQRAAHGRSSRRVPADVAYRQLLFASLPFFMSQLLDPAGHPLEVAPHHAEWCAYMAGWAMMGPGNETPFQSEVPSDSDVLRELARRE